MELTDELVELNEQINYWLFEEMLLSRIAYWLLTAMCLVFFVIAIVKLIKRKWRSLHLAFVCLFMLVWSLLSLLSYHSNDPVIADNFYSLRLIMFVPIPALLAIHIHRQVSYKPIRIVAIMFYSLIPLFIVLVLTGVVYAPQPQTGISQIFSVEWATYIFYFYSAVAIINSFLLCFNVFYQMPPRARRSTRSVLVSIITLVIILIAYSTRNLVPYDALHQENIVLGILLPPAIPVLFMIFLYPLFDSMYIMPASDVIVTSREFIMKGMSTTVYVLNKRQLILDWNRKDWGTENPLLKPVYKENYQDYINRVLNLSSGKLSPHSGDIFILKTKGKEYHLMQRLHEVGTKKSKLGYIAEIFEITPIYIKLRHFEQIAHIDTLTGLFNRNAYIEYVDNIDNVENLPLLVFVGDINRLKLINDKYGHIEGDSLIKNAASAINRIKPVNSFLARVGGDEFVLLVPNSSEEFAEEFIKEAIDICGSVPHSEEFVPAVSWGYALMSSEDQSYNDVFAEADKMMYEFKKNRIEFSSSGALPSKNKAPTESDAL